MSKADTLLKKSIFYERMAIYSDRKTFLQALAQDGGLVPPRADIRQGIDSAMRDLTMTKPGDPRALALSNKLQGFYDGTNTDMGQLAEILRDAANTIPGNLTNQVQRILDLASKVDQLVQKQSGTERDPGEGETPMVFDNPTARITGFAPINIEEQEALSRFVTMQEIGIPLSRIDGKLGPDTRRALEAARKYWTEKSPNKQKLSDSQLLKNIKYLIDNNPEKYGDA